MEIIVIRVCTRIPDYLIGQPKRGYAGTWFVGRWTPHSVPKAKGRWKEEQ